MSLDLPRESCSFSHGQPRESNSVSSYVSSVSPITFHSGDKLQSNVNDSSSTLENVIECSSNEKAVSTLHSNVQQARNIRTNDSCTKSSNNEDDLIGERFDFVDGMEIGDKDEEHSTNTDSQSCVVSKVCDICHVVEAFASVKPSSLEGTNSYAVHASHDAITILDNDKNSCHVCHSCMFHITQEQKKNERNRNLIFHLDKTIPYFHPQWSSKVYSIPNVVRRLSSSNFSKTLAKFYDSVLRGETHSNFSHMYERSLNYRVMDLRTLKGKKSDRKQHIANLQGSSFNSSEEYLKYIEHSISRPSDGTIGLILLPYADYIMLMPTYMDYSDIVDVATKESLQMLQKPLNTRFGSASGIVTSSTMSSSLPKYVRDARSGVVEDGKSHCSLLFILDKSNCFTFSLY